jgi:putative nucleotidyltransferase with HDIG domain
MLSRSTFAAGVNRSDVLRFVVAATLMAFTLGGLLALDALPGSLPGSGTVNGDIALADIRAPRAQNYTSAVETERVREAARSRVPPQYDYSLARAQIIGQRQALAFEREVQPIDAAFAAVLSDDARRQALRDSIPDLSPAARTTLVELDRPGWNLLRAAMLRTLQALEESELRDTLLDDVRASLPDQLDDSIAPAERALAAEMLSPLVIANSTFDADATERARDEAANAVAPVEIRILRSELIARSGQRIDELTREKLELFGLLDPRPDLARAGGWLLLAAMAVGLLLGWLWRFRPQIWHRNGALILIGLLLVGAVIALKVTADRSVLPYLVPVAAIGLLLAVLLDASVAIVVSAMLALIAGAVAGTVEFAAFVFLSSLAGIIVVRRGERLSHFLQAGLVIALVNLGVVTIFSLLGERDLTGLVELAAAGVGSASLAAIVSVGSFALLGDLFGITTSFQLLELANPSQPLLRRLLLETPGTYHHSLMVGNLAERAAEAIGADPLLTRVAAYYHDIGKLANPLAFIENQSDGDNIHDELAPEESVSLLKSHVAGGIDLAYQYRLPKSIIPFIPQHHGTALMSYFHARAKEQSVETAGARPGTPAAETAESTVDAERFRHAGPKPQSKEAAILMLADSVEASVRSLTAQDEPAVRAMVARIILERLEDGQFDECDLTLRDLEQIREAFVAQLLGMYHRRIEYPQNKIVEIESRRPAGRAS